MADYRRGYYSIGNNALSPNYDNNETEWVREQRKPTIAPRKKQKVDKKYVFCMTLCWSVIFVSCFLFVGLYSVVITKEFELKSQVSELNRLQSAINTVQSQISMEFDIEEVKERAYEAGLKEPLGHQVVYITLPLESRTIRESK
jgi:hypothetical protein